MDKAKVKIMRIEIDEALQLIAKDHGLSLGVGNIRFTDTGFKAQVICEEKNADGVNARYLKDWEEAVRLDLVKAEWLGVITTQRRNGNRMKVIGYDFAKLKNCVVLEEMASGKLYITSKTHFDNPVFRSASLMTQEGKDAS